MTDITLNPCPFCNGHAVMWDDGDPRYPWCVTFEHADDCPLSAVPTEFFQSYPTEDEARDAWSARPASTEPADALKDDLSALQGFLGEVAGTCLALAMSTNHPDPDGALMGLFEKAQALPEAMGRIRAALTRTDALAEAREALEEAREALHFHYVEWDGEPEDAVPLQLARQKCDAALSRLNAQGEVK